MSNVCPSPVQYRLYATAYPRTGDQAKPICSQCQKKDRPCLREDPSNRLRIKPYQIPKNRKISKDAPELDHDERSPLSENGTASAIIANTTNPEHINNQFYTDSYNKEYHNASVMPLYCTQGTSTQTTLPAPLMASPANNNTTPSPYFSAVSIPISQLLRADHPSPLSPASPAGLIHAGSPLTYKEAYLVHHFATHLGYWLDCTDASRQFTRKIPVLVKQSPILLHAVISYAARHVGDAEMAERAHERCVELLIPCLSSETVVDDDVLLCAIVILRVFEQLNGK